MPVAESTRRCPIPTSRRPYLLPPLQPILPTIRPAHGSGLAAYAPAETPNSHWKTPSRTHRSSAFPAPPRPPIPDARQLCSHTAEHSYQEFWIPPSCALLWWPSHL